nr:immunoglobulin heavy chain junction region [Macaca mulatta]MOV53513.1 immunoglobulin heavy chain junction region [Macaca mulatta]MOV53544.1 immunoglobulin heavy chain junction region [Macaca mulatta]MOV53901.1 immunoglobulin heavy chain junction region [Macaca mulatta]MOV56419.1 immunoglobulin heavy chain junction region [Macaca mulatta]
CARNPFWGDPYYYGFDSW